MPGLGPEASYGWARKSETVTIPLEERKRLLDDLSVFDVPIGEEDIAARKSIFFFRTAEQVESWEKAVLKSRREKRKIAIRMMKRGPQQEKLQPESAAIGTHSTTAQALNQQAVEETPGRDIWYFDAEKERRFFRRRGAIVAASISQRSEIISGQKYHHFYEDGRPTGLCRISSCFQPNCGSLQQFLCVRHYNMIEHTAKSEPITIFEGTESNEECNSEEAEHRDTEGNESTLQDIVHSCPYCKESAFNSYEELVHHERDCGTVDEATKITGEILLKFKETTITFHLT